MVTRAIGSARARLYGILNTLLDRHRLAGGEGIHVMVAHDRIAKFSKQMALKWLREEVPNHL